MDASQHPRGLSIRAGLMPVIGAPVVAQVEDTKFGALVRLINRTGSRRVFVVGTRRVCVDGNTTAGVVSAEDSTVLQVSTAEDGMLWPRPVE